jgi:VCBS repeat-containing protein
LSSEADAELAFANSSLGAKGTYGNLTLTPTGNYAYSIDNENITVQALRTLKNTLTDTFTYRLEDGSLGQFIVTIRGANDAPISTSDFADATESGGLSNTTLGTK